MDGDATAGADQLSTGFGISDSRGPTVGEAEGGAAGGNRRLRNQQQIRRPQLNGTAGGIEQDDAWAL